MTIKEGECLYCYSCGKQKLYMKAENSNMFACANCKAEYVMLSIKDFKSLQENQQYPLNNSKEETESK